MISKLKNPSSFHLYPKKKEPKIILNLKTFALYSILLHLNNDNV